VLKYYTLRLVLKKLIAQRWFGGELLQFALVQEANTPKLFWPPSWHSSAVLDPKLLVYHGCDLMDENVSVVNIESCIMCKDCDR
jgi:hypothetical protein